MANEIIVIRDYQQIDLDSLYDICLKTGDSGKDATNIYKDPKLLGHFYAAPYAVLEPDLTFIVTLDGMSSGYILGTKNSEEFRKKTETEWFPNLREKYIFPDQLDGSADAKIIRQIHQGYELKKELVNFPAHLHIDLLPNAQGKGLGRKLINVFIDKLKEINISALHLEVGKKNKGAIEFYKKMGFRIIHEYEFSIAFGMHLY